MIQNVRYVHTNLVARDWRRLTRFYQDLFGCTPVLPERDLAGEWLEQATGVPAAQIQGVHLRLPGWGDQGPTLEVFTYNQLAAGSQPAVNRPGLGHLAFAVDDVAQALEAVLAAGGHTLGELVSLEIENAGTVTFVYCTDPEGNVLELQSWS